MDYEARLSISFYREVASINQEHKISLVQHRETNKFYVKKILDVYNADVYRQLQETPVKGIPQIYALFEDGNNLTVIEEYISGETLQEHLNKYGVLSPDIVAGYIIQLCDILSTLHNLKPAIIHRDIKPSNIMVTPSGQIVLLDLNAAKYVDFTKSEDTALLGTKGFAAPEQYGFGSSTIQTDVYAVGVLINILLTGTLPNQGIAGGKFNPIIQKSTKLRPNDRYRTMYSLKEAVLDLDLCKENSYLPKKTYTGSFLPPGYRNKNVFHIAVATLGYIMIFWLGCSYEPTNATLSTLIIDRVCLTLMMLAMVFFICNYKNIQSFFPLCSSQNKFIKIVGIILFNMLIFLTFIIIMLAFEAFSDVFF